MRTATSAWLLFEVTGMLMLVALFGGTAAEGATRVWPDPSPKPSQSFASR